MAELRRLLDFQGDAREFWDRYPRERGQGAEIPEQCPLGFPDLRHAHENESVVWPAQRSFRRPASADCPCLKLPPGS